MGGDSCSTGREFESQHRILDGHFSHLFVVKKFKRRFVYTIVIGVIESKIIRKLVDVKFIYAYLILSRCHTVVGL